MEYSDYIVITTPEKMEEMVSFLLDKKYVDNIYEIEVEFKNFTKCELKGSDYLLSRLSKYPCKKIFTDVAEFALELIPYYEVCVPLLDEVLCHKRIWQIE